MKTGRHKPLRVVKRVLPAKVGRRTRSGRAKNVATVLIQRTRTVARLACGVQNRQRISNQMKEKMNGGHTQTVGPVAASITCKRFNNIASKKA